MKIEKFIFNLMEYFSAVIIYKRLGVFYFYFDNIDKDKSEDLKKIEERNKIKKDSFLNFRKRYSFKGKETRFEKTFIDSIYLLSKSKEEFINLISDFKDYELIFNDGSEEMIKLILEKNYDFKTENLIEKMIEFFESNLKDKINYHKIYQRKYIEVPDFGEDLTGDNYDFLNDSIVFGNGYVYAHKDRYNSEIMDKIQKIKSQNQKSK